MSGNDESDSRFLIIYRFMWSRLGLSGVTLHVFARIYGFCRDEGSLFYESRASTARFLGTTARTVSRSISELLACGLIVEQGERSHPQGGITKNYALDWKTIRDICTEEHDESSSSATEDGAILTEEFYTPDESSPPDNLAGSSALNPDGSSGSPVTGCHPINKRERKTHERKTYV